MPEVTTEGAVGPGFEKVRDAFASLFSDHGEVGSSLYITVDGANVADLWGGWADGERTRPWKRDTLVNVYSTSKGITAIAAAVLLDRGQLDVEAPVAAYWPEFAQQGKGEIPVKWLLSHQAGLPVVDSRRQSPASCRR